MNIGQLMAMQIEGEEEEEDEDFDEDNEGPADEGDGDVVDDAYKEIIGMGKKKNEIDLGF
jgi:hypothetical protein